MITITDLYLKKRIPEISKLSFNIPEREVYVLLSSEETAVNHLINIFLGLERGFKGTVAVDSTDITGNWKVCRSHIAYLDTGGLWPPDLKVGDVVAFFKKRYRIPEDEFEELYIKLNLENISLSRIGELEAPAWRRLLFALKRLERSNNYIMNDFARGMPLDFILEFKKNIHQLKAAGSSILYLSDDVFFAPEIGDRIGFMKKGKLLLELKAQAMKKMSLKELYFQFLAER